MKKIFITLSLLISIHTIYSQNRRVVVDKCINNVNVYGPPGIICSNDTKTKWFTITPICQLDGRRLYSEGLTVLRFNIGNLSKEDQLFFSFKDGYKLRLESGVKLTSDNNVFFSLTELEFAIIKSKEIISIRYINGNDFSSFQYTLIGDEKTYFMNLFNNFYIREVYCD